MNWDLDLKETRFYQQALSEGERIGHAKGEAAMLLRQLARRFGPPSEAVRQRIAGADADTLLVWGERLLEAQSVEEIFQ